MVDQHDRVRGTFLQTFYGIKTDDPAMFDLCLNTELADPDMACEFLTKLVTKLTDLSIERKKGIEIEDDTIMQSAISEVLGQK